MKNILVMGGGKIGEMISSMLADCGDYMVTVADRDEMTLARITKHQRIETAVVDALDEKAMDAVMAGKYAVLMACGHVMTHVIAPAAKKAGAHYFDLTEDVKSTRLVKDLAEDSETAFIPQCGLAPGFIGIVAHHLTKNFDTLHNVHMRVGALPVMPSNALKYNLTWSTDGLINEYCQPCEAIIDGVKTETPPLEQLENLCIDGVEYEAFNTSGGLGTLCETLEGRVRNLNYRTMRYPGHRDILKLLLQDLRLNERQDLMREIFENALPLTQQDVVVIYATVSGTQNGKFMQESYSQKVYAGEVNGKMQTGIQITTAAGICCMLDMLVNGDLPQKGFVRQEDADFNIFIANRFGSAYAKKEGVDQLVINAAE
ncbi:saccharopine dehydrogenase C-terminal domain-containing protein [Temperatibacter marinus]|uniref:Saccharopine dehydrogenase C-terminal domain-containing protein n=1 Tax=Temperatibacter marinus TaxID=1456591 RepID=A0AA52EFM8_9PROT|nr:saccharopine dehydrogenase C-terminal domain-containing protein [Temperatibacter marinus]WND01654.1 saccharopine dehydrogenase C-terminal domain-containing protein [Temperatibacter marinus]